MHGLLDLLSQLFLFPPHMSISPVLAAGSRDAFALQLMCSPANCTATCTGTLPFQNIMKKARTMHKYYR